MRAEPGQVCPIMNWSGYGSAFSLGDRQMPLDEPPPKGRRFGSPLVRSRVHWVSPEMVVEVSYVEWTPDGLLRHVVYLGERQDKLATEVRRSRPHAGEP
jgi:ATP-dependent DNA ligase